MSLLLISSQPFCNNRLGFKVTVKALDWQGLTFRAVYDQSLSRKDSKDTHPLVA